VPKSTRIPWLSSLVVLMTPRWTMVLQLRSWRECRQNGAPVTSIFFFGARVMVLLFPSMRMPVAAVRSS